MRSAIAWLFFTTLCYGQMGQIVGRLTDSTNAVIVGATITAINQGTRLARKVESSPDGNYSVPLLEPGSYALLIQAHGFKSITREDIVLRVDQIIRLDFTMEVGLVTTSVDVTGESEPVLAKTTATLSTVIETKRILDLPLNGRDPLSLASLAPTVFPSATMFFGTVTNIGGGRSATAEVMLDGTTIDLAENNASISSFSYTPPVDSVREFSVETNSLSAEYGRTGGGLMNIVTKQGTNAAHGTLYEFLRNSKTDANNFFSNRAGQPLAAFQRNQFGGTFGGPVYLPRIYNGKNRTFFFLGYQATRTRQADVVTTTVPLDQWKQGDFSNLRNSAGASIVLYDPLTTTTQPNAQGAYTRTAFPGNVIPATRIDPVGHSIAQYYPEPNTTPANQYTQASNFIDSGKDMLRDDRADIRLDENISSAYRISGRISGARALTNNLDPFGAGATSSVQSRKSKFYGVSLAHTYIISPTAILSIRYGLGRYDDSDFPYSQGFNLQTVGLPSSMEQYTAALNLQFPTVTVSSLGGLGAGYTRWRTTPTTHAIYADFTKVLSRHVIKAGVQYRKMFLNFLQYSYPAGNFSFGANWTQSNPTAASTTQGFGLASLLLGTATGGSTGVDPTTAAASNYWAGYIQDDFRLTNSLTLNIGFRYDVDIPRTERYNRLSMFDFNSPSPIAGKVAGFPNLVGAMDFVNSQDRHQTPIDLNNVGPRFGFAYNFTSKWVARGGYGILYPASCMQAAGNTGVNGMEGYSSTTTMVPSLDSRTPTTFLSNPFPNGFNLPLGATPGPMSGPSTNLGLGLGASLFIDYVNPMVQQWNFSLQRELPGNFVVEAAYVGNKGNHLIDGDTMNMDQLPASDMSLGNTLSDLVSNPFYGVITNPTSVLSQPTVTRAQLLRPYPQYTSMGALRKPQGNSLYHAFALRVEKHYSKGLGLLLSYTGGKLIDDFSQLWSSLGTLTNKQNYYDRRAERAVSAEDISSRFVLSVTYEMPFGRGKRFSQGGPVIQWLVSGWQANGIVTLQTGTPIVVSQSQNNTGIGTTAQRPNSSGTSAAISGGSKGSRLLRWYNISAFSVAPPFTFGDVGRTLPDVRNPGKRNADLSVFRNFQLREDRMRLQFRVEAFNAANTAQFSAPGAVIDTASAGIISSTAVAARQLQFALKLIF